MNPIVPLSIDQFGGHAPLEARGTVGPHRFAFRAHQTEWTFSVATDDNADPATFDVREQIGFGIFGSTDGLATSPLGIIAEERARELLIRCAASFWDVTTYLHSVGTVLAYVPYRDNFTLQGIPELRIIHFGGSGPVQAWGQFGQYSFYFRARHDGWMFGVAAAGVDPADVYAPTDGFCVFGPYGRTGGEDASWMPEEVALSLIIRGARCFLAMATLFEPQLDDA